jgi:hypothetical protein
VKPIFQQYNKLAYRSDKEKELKIFIWTEVIIIIPQSKIQRADNQEFHRKNPRRPSALSMSTSAEILTT